MKAYMIKSVNSNLSSHHDPYFFYPRRGRVECPDWRDSAYCGNGLHGFLNGQGDSSLATWEATWLVLSIDMKTVVDLGGKIKVPYGSVVHVGDIDSAVKFLGEKGITHRVMGRKVVLGDCGSAEGGDRSDLTGGARSDLTAGNVSTVTCGRCSHVVVGNVSKVVAGSYSRVTCGPDSEVTCGNYGAVYGDYSCDLIGGVSSLLVGKTESTFMGDIGAHFVHYEDGARSTTVSPRGKVRPGVKYMCVRGLWRKA